MFDQIVWHLKLQRISLIIEGVELYPFCLLKCDCYIMSFSNDLVHNACTKSFSFSPCTRGTGDDGVGHPQQECFSVMEISIIGMWQVLSM